MARFKPNNTPRNKLSVDWDAEPLGAETDTAIARRLAVSSGSVRLARRARGIPPYTGSGSARKGIDWDVQPLGLMHDVVLAGVLGCSIASVHYARARRGIPACRQPAAWGARDLSGTDREIAARYGCHPQTVKKQRLRRRLLRRRTPKSLAEHEGEFGSIPDSVVAVWAGVSVRSIYQARRALGVPPVAKTVVCYCGAKHVTSARRRWTTLCSDRCHFRYRNATKYHRFGHDAAAMYVANMDLFDNTKEMMNEQEQEQGTDAGQQRRGHGGDLGDQVLAACWDNHAADRAR